MYFYQYAIRVSTATTATRWQPHPPAFFCFVTGGRAGCTSSTIVEKSFWYTTLRVHALVGAHRGPPSQCVVCCSKNRKKFLQLKLVLFQLKLLHIVSTASHLNEWCSYRLTKYRVTILPLMKLFTADLANYNGHFTFAIQKCN